MQLSKCFKTLAIMLGMAMSISLVSCGDDEPDDPNKNDNNSNNGNGSTTTEASYTVHTSYDINLSQAFYDYFDIKVSFTATTGELQTLDLTQNAVWSTATVAYTNAPKNYYLVVTATPKANYPAIDASTTYYFDASCLMNIYKYTDAEKDNPTPYRKISYQMSNPLTISGDQMEKFMSKSYTFVNRSINIDSGEITDHKND